MRIDILRWLPRLIGYRHPSYRTEGLPRVAERQDGYESHPENVSWQRAGGTLWIDNLAIPKGARNVDSAYAFLDYLMEPGPAAKVVNGVHYAGANQAALPRIDATIRQNPSIYPPKEILDRCELIEDLGKTTQLIDELWTEVKAQ